MSVHILAEDFTLTQTWKFLKPKEAVYNVKIFCAFLTVWVIGSFLSSANIYLLCTVYYAGEGNGTPLQYSCLENPMDGGAWWAAVHEVTKSPTQLSDFTFTFHFHALEKEMATHSIVLAWRIPGMGEPGGLPSMGLHRVGHDWSDLAAAAAVYYVSGTVLIIKRSVTKSDKDQAP